MKAVAAVAGTRRQPISPVIAAKEARVREAAEDAERQKDLYGVFLDDAKLLRSRGYGVTAEKTGHFRVGNVVVDGATLKAKADRERRLLGEPVSDVRRPAATAGGLKVGEAVALAPRKPKSAARSSSGPVAPRRLSGAAAASKAKAAEHSTDLGVKPRVVWLDLGLLDVDRRYQRDVTGHGQAHINRILRAFNWNRYQPIVVTEGADGRYAVIDGQHRLEAAKKHPLIDSLPCYVIDAPELAAQAAIFVAVNSDRRPLTGLQKFWARTTAGDREAQALVKTCEEAGVTIPRTTPQGGLSARTLIGPAASLILVGRFGREPVHAAIRLLSEVWPTAATGFRSATLGAVATIASTPYSHERLTRALKSLDPDKLYAEALGLAGAASTLALTAATGKLIRVAMERR